MLHYLGLHCLPKYPFKGGFGPEIMIFARIQFFIIDTDQTADDAYLKTVCLYTSTKRFEA